jgi:hypothetical protein
MERRLLVATHESLGATERTWNDTRAAMYGSLDSTERRMARHHIAVMRASRATPGGNGATVRRNSPRHTLTNVTPRCSLHLTNLTTH